jgi:putative hemolysin
MPEIFKYCETIAMGMAKAKMVVVLFSLILISSLLLACHAKPQKYMASGPEQAAGMANPASVFCTNQSGNSWSVKEDPAGNQYGICTFPDASWCDEWDYYQGNCKPGFNYTSCGQQFAWKSTCPQDYNSVCAFLNSTGQWQTFSNNCKACIKSEGNAAGYVHGECPE